MAGDLQSCASIASMAATGLLVASLASEVVGAPPTSLDLPTLDGERFVHLSDFPGRPVLVNFWSSECPPCVKEMPVLAAAAMRWSQVQFVGVAVDERPAARAFVERHTPGFLQLIATRQPEVLLRRLGDRLGALPFTVVLDTQHRPCATHQGEVDAAWIDAAVSTCSRKTS